MNDLDRVEDALDDAIATALDAFDSLSAKAFGAVTADDAEMIEHEQPHSLGSRS